MTLVSKDVEDYVAEMTQPVDPVFDELREETYRDLQSPHMQVGKVEGTFLRFLVAMTKAKRVLELGTFTGYSALMMASALPDDGVLYTLDNNAMHLNIARRYFEKVAFGHKIRPMLGDASEVIPTLDGPFDLAFIDADKLSYDAYYEMILPKMRSGGLIVFDNMLRRGSVLDPRDQMALATSRLNSKITDDDRVENVLLTVRDGIMLVLKK